VIQGIKRIFNKHDKDGVRQKVVKYSVNSSLQSDQYVREIITLATSEDHARKLLETVAIVPATAQGEVCVQLGGYNPVMPSLYGVNRYAADDRFYNPGDPSIEEIV